VVILFALLQAIGVRGSININSLFSLVNVAVMLFVGTYGMSFADASNWDDFTPYGINGVLQGATSCFFAYVGLDSMAVAAEEAKDPGYSVPRATFYAMGIVTIGYLLVSTSLTLMVPYDHINVNAALPGAFIYNGAEWAQYLVSIAAIAGMSSVLYGHMYTVPRYVYSMASDGLVFRVFASVNKRTQVPMINTLMLGGIAALMALLLDIRTLVEFLAMGTLVGYSMVAMAVLMLRYSPTLLNPDGTQMTDCIGGELKQSCHFLDPFITRLPYASVPCGAIYTFTVVSFLLSYLIAHTENPGSVVVVIVILFMAFTLAGCGAVLLAFEQTEPRTFAVPFCPVVPLLSVGFNMVLLSYLQPGTWLRFLVWMLAGLLIYFCYGIRHSTADESWKQLPLSEQEHKPQWYDPATGGAGGSSLQPAGAPAGDQPPPSDSSIRPPVDGEERTKPAGVEPRERSDTGPESRDFRPQAGYFRSEAADFRGAGDVIGRPGLRRQSTADTDMDSLPSLTHDQAYRTAY